MIFNKRPPSGSAAEVKLEAYESLDEEDKQWIDQLAYEVEILFEEEGIYKANKHMHEAIDGCDNEWHLALWWKLNSKTRSSLKRKT